jgi:hypothetical protein
MTPPETAVAVPPELLTYERLREQIKAKDNGKFALIQGEELVGIFATPAEVCAVANRCCAGGRFLVKRIGAREPYRFLGEGPLAPEVLKPVTPRWVEPQAVDASFARELATYERHRADLERHHPNRVALVYGDQLIGTYATPEEADARGAERFGAEKFLIKEIGDPAYFCPLAVLPAPLASTD